MELKSIMTDKYEDKSRMEELDADSLAPWQKTLLYFVIIGVVFNIIALVYVQSGKYIYFWDDATYWDISRSIASGGISKGGFWHNVLNSIAQEDYNYVAALPSALIARLFSPSRLAYILGLINMYLMPICIMIYLLAKKISKSPKLTTVITLLIFPCMLFLTLIGLVDIGALLICLICYYLYFSRNGVENAFWRYLIIGALLVFVMIWRRYFTFFTVSFMTSVIADCVLFRRKWYNSFIMVLTMAAIMFFCFHDFLVNKLMANYGSLYSGYKFSLMTDFKLITRYFGLLFPAVLAVCSIRLGIVKKESRFMFLWLQMTVSIVMFLSLQTHGQQHLILYLPSLIMLTLIIIRYITKEWTLIGIMLVAAIHTVSVYLPRVQPTNIQEIRYLSLIPSFSMKPAPRDDSEEILALKRKLDTTVYEGDTLGVLASSFIINEDILRNAEPSLGVSPIRDNYIVSLPQVDSRDTDLSPLYNVNYILAAFPAQTHLAEGSQTVVTEAVRSFENYADIATAYEEVPDFETVIDGITFRLYHRERDEYKKDTDEFEARLYK